MRWVWVIFVFAVGSLAFACCPTDDDGLAKEGETVPDAIPTLANTVERKPLEYWRGELKRDDLSPSQRVHALTQIGAFDDALAACETDEQRLHVYLTEFFATQEIDRDALETLIDRLKTDSFEVRIARWILQSPKAEDDRMLPDFFGLRLAANKTANRDNTALKDAGLNEAADWLLAQVRQHRAWYHPDVVYQLVLLFAVDGKQSLAQFAREALFDLWGNGYVSVVDGAGGLKNYRLNTYPRQPMSGALKVIRTLTEDQKAAIHRSYQDSKAGNFANESNTKPSNHTPTAASAPETKPEPEGAYIAWWMVVSLSCAFVVLVIVVFTVVRGKSRA